LGNQNTNIQLGFLFIVSKRNLKIDTIEVLKISLAPGVVSC